MATELPLHFKQGVDETRTITLLDSNENPINLTGCTFASQIRSTADSSSVIATLTCTALDQTVTGNLGKFTLTLAAATSAAISIPAVSGTPRPTLSAVYDVEMTDADDKVSRPVQGPFYLEAEITKI